MHNGQLFLTGSLLSLPKIVDLLLIIFSFLSHDSIRGCVRSLIHWSITDFTTLSQEPTFWIREIIQILPCLDIGGGTSLAISLVLALGF